MNLFFSCHSTDWNPKDSHSIWLEEQEGKRRNFGEKIFSWFRSLKENNGREITGTKTIPSHFFLHFNIQRICFLPLPSKQAIREKLIFHMALMSFWNPMSLIPRKLFLDLHSQFFTSKADTTIVPSSCKYVKHQFRKAF